MNSTTNNQTAILITTRYFEDSHLAGCNTISHSNLSFFDRVIKDSIINRINIEDYENVYGNVDIETYHEFFEKLKNCIPKIDFNGHLRQIKGANIFFYHHYPDRQLRGKIEDSLPSIPYIVGLIYEIVKINTKVKKIILVLHKGDLLGVSLLNKGETKDSIESKLSIESTSSAKKGKTEEVVSFYEQILKKVKDLSINIDVSKIYTFSHDASSDPIWRYCLNKPDFFKNIEGSKEKYLAGWLDPEKANEYFNIFKYTTK